MKTKLTILLLAIFYNLNIAIAQNEAVGFDKINKKEYFEAQKIFESILKSNQQSSAALFGKGECFYYTGVLDSAKSYYQKGIEVNSTYPCNYAGLGKLQLGSPTDETENYFKIAVKKSKKDAQAIIVIAKAYFDLIPKKLDEAKHYIDLAISVSPKDAYAYYINGLIELERNNASSASLQFERAIYFNPKLFDAYLWESEIMNRTRNYSQAVEYINKIIAIDPNYWKAYKNLGELNYDNQDYANAIKNFEIYYKNVPEDNDVTHFAYSLFFMKQYQLARDMISKLAAKNPNDFILLRLLGYISFETKDFANGKNIMEKFFSLVPQDKILADDYSYYGKMLSVSGYDSLAIENYRLSFIKDSSKIQILDEIAKSYYKLKNFESSFQYSNEYLKKKPNIVTADYFQLGKSYYAAANNLDIKVDSLKQIEYYTIADSLFSKVAVYSPTSYLGPFWRARVNSALDAETTQGLAKPLYESALEILIKDPVKYKKEVTEIYSYLGFYFYQKQENQQSLIFWKKLLEVDPENSKAIEAIKALEKK